MANKVRRSSRFGQIRKIAWDRDRKNGAVCHICNQPINYSLQPSSCETAWEPDHIIPFITRPDLELDLDNIAASHRRCNRARCSKEIICIGRQSRIW